MAVIKEICFKNIDKGSSKYRMGIEVGDGLCTGDIVIWEHKSFGNGKPVLSFIADKNCIMGLWNTPFDKFSSIKRIVKHEDVTNSIFNHLFKEYIVVETDAVEMTIEEIEKKLGYSIVLKNNN